MPVQLHPQGVAGAVRGAAQGREKPGGGGGAGGGGTPESEGGADVEM